MVSGWPRREGVGVGWDMDEMCRWCCWYAGRAPFMRSGDISRPPSLSSPPIVTEELPRLLLGPGRHKRSSPSTLAGDEWPLEWLGLATWVLLPPLLLLLLFTTTTTTGEAAAIATLNAVPVVVVEEGFYESSRRLSL